MDVRICFMHNKCLGAIVNILFPRRCFMCNKIIQSGVLCEECEMKIHFLKPPLCRICAKEINNNLYVCRSCRGRKIYYDNLISCTAYKEPIKTLVHLVKYRHYDYIINFLSSLMVQYISKINIPIKNYDYMVNVPSHPLKLREREYNQSRLLAQNLSNSLGIPLKSDIIFCKNNRPSQTAVSKEMRAKNVENNFLVREKLDNMDIIIIDDVITTGATLSECAKALKEKGANSVLALTLAKA